jgi:hypothetical protein
LGKRIAKDVSADLIAINGKVARRSFSTKDRKNPLHMVSVWSCSHGLVQGQQKVDENLTKLRLFLNY